MKSLIALFFILLTPAMVFAKPLVADLSQYKIEIDSGFNGTRLLLFGARNETGDIVVAVRGPEKSITVRKKDRIFGVWMNNEKQKFDDVPTYYIIASSKPLKDMNYPELFKSLHIGFQEALNSSGEKENKFSDALVHYEQIHNLYSETASKVSFMGESLFKFVIPFPDNIPRGNYSADVYLFNDGQLTSMQSIPIEVQKTGLDAFLYDFAHSSSVIYGLFCVLLALLMGWGASSLMSRI